MKRDELRALVEEEIEPMARRADLDQVWPREFLDSLGQRGLWGWNIARSHGGSGRSVLECGVLHEEIGRRCSSLRAMLTVHQMAAEAIGRWGSSPQRERWLPGMARGTTRAALALTESQAGSDATAITMQAEPTCDGYRVTGEKKWVTNGQLAAVFLVFAKANQHTTAFLVPREAKGIRITPCQGMLGLRAAMIANVTFDGVELPADAALGPVQAGIDHVAARALHFGRLAVAFGCVGMAKACLEMSLAHAVTRRQFGASLFEHQLIQRRLAEIVVGIRTSELLCTSAARMVAEAEPGELLEVLSAKYHAARIAAESAAQAVQILGARGCEPDHLAGRFFRDGKVMEIIEGTTEVLQIGIAKQAGFAL